MPAAAIVGSAVLGAVASKHAGDKAAAATTQAANTATQAQQDAIAQQAQLSAPYRALGESAIPQLKDLLGLSGKDPTAALRATPGYQFARDEGLTGAKNAATASGMLLSGNTLEALDKYGTGLADQTYQQAVQNSMGVTGLGQAAAAGQAANVGQAAGNIGNIAIGQGNNLAGISANEIAGITRALGGGVDTYILNNTLSGLINPGGGASIPEIGLSPGVGYLPGPGSGGMLPMPTFPG
jgi:hypothetical protein